MDLNDLLPGSENDKTRGELYTIRAVLSVAMHHYAEDALESAHEVLQVALRSGPMCEAFDPQYQYGQSAQRCYEAMQAVRMVNTGILNLEETTDPDIDDANAEHKQKTVDFLKVNAMLEAAQNRIHTAAASFPPDMRPGATCNGAIYTVQPQQPPGQEAQEDDG